MKRKTMTAANENGRPTPRTSLVVYEVYQEWRSAGRGRDRRLWNGAWGIYRREYVKETAHFYVDARGFREKKREGMFRDWKKALAECHRRNNEDKDRAMFQLEEIERKLVKLAGLIREAA